MKQHIQCLAAALAVACGLAAAGSAPAQSITGGTYLSIDPTTFGNGTNALYASWQSGTVTSGANGVEVSAAGYGSFYYLIPPSQRQTLNPADTLATLIFTVNSPSVSSINWMGTPFILDDNSGAVTLGGYSASGNPGSDPGTTWNGNVVTETESLSAAELAAIQAGTDSINGFNLEDDPYFAGPPIYDITFNSLTLSPAPTPEPTTLALAALGAAGLLAARRRK